MATKTADFSTGPRTESKRFWADVKRDAMDEARQLRVFEIAEAAHCHPESLRHVSAYAKHLVRVGKPEHAMKVLDKLVTKNENKFLDTERTRIGQRYDDVCCAFFSSGRFIDSIEAAEKMENVCPASAYFSKWMIIRANIGLGNTELAITQCIHYLKQFPNDAEVLKILGSQLLEYDDSEVATWKARDCFLKAIKQKDCDRKNVYYNLGLVYDRLENPKKAMYYYKKSLRFGETDYALESVGAHYKSDALVQIQNGDKVIYSNGNIIGTETYYVITNDDGDCILSSRKLKKAEQYFRKAIDINPYYAPAIDGVYNVMMNMGRFKEAKLFKETHIRQKYEHQEEMASNAGKSSSYF